MSSEIFLESITPTRIAFINAMILVTLVGGFIAIVSTNKKYRYLFDYIERFF